MQKNLRTGLTTFSLATATLGLYACGGGGGGGQLELTSISVPNNAIWEINRPIEMAFTLPVDMGSVNSNSISIRTVSGEPALGEFSRKLDEDGNEVANVIVFQPRCPTESDLSDAGLNPDGEFYELQILGADVSVGSAVKSTSGETLVESQQRVFTTPLGTTAQEVFLDTKLGSPRVVLREAGDAIVQATRLEVVPTDAFDDGRRYFEIQPPAIGGIKVEDFDSSEPDYPINLFSDAASQLSVVVVFDQPVSPDDENITSDRIELQFSTSGVGGPFERVDASVELEANCTSAGARVRITPIGVLPQDADLRVVVSPDFQDIVGEQGLNPISDFAPFRTRIESSELFGDSVLADEIFESFAVGGSVIGSLEQVEPTFPEPQANWGDGRLRASFEFLGTGGPGGSFDWLVQAGSTSILNTDNDSISGGPGFTGSQTQTIANGVINVANLRVEEGAVLRITGTQPAKIFATGQVEILGTIDIRGLDALAVSQLQSPNNPQPGAGTVAGSGKGGRGSPLTTSSSPKGEDGFGPSNLASAGGVGGESGYRTGTSDESRRGGGGGGGVFADPDQLSATGQGALAAISGFGGATNADGALDGQPGFGFADGPQGGIPGPTIFVDGNLTNDFFGLLFDPGADPVSEIDDIFIAGEMTLASAGTGGGGGGDTIKSDQFPAESFILGNEKKGGGGGSGGGQLQLLALGDIILGANAQILADGGRGGEGESTAGTNQVGGGGAGGSGGHVILQTSGRLDLSAGPASGSVSAVGGAGAKGKNDSFTGQSAGGIGGAGVIQIHLRDFDDAGSGGAVIPPAGQTVDAALDAITRPNAWRLFPSFGNRSRARSQPIPLGAVGANTPGDLVLYGFRGLNLTPPALSSDPSLNAIRVTAGNVDALDPLLSEANAAVTAVDSASRTVSILVDQADFAALVAEGVSYCYDVDGNVVDCGDPVGTGAGVVDIETFSNDVYFRNEALLEGFGFAVTGAGFSDTLLRVESATLVDLSVGAPGTGDVRLDLVLAEGEGTLNNVTTLNISTFSLFPRYFRVMTGGQLDNLPLDQEILIRLRGLGADLDGAPDTTTPLVDWTGDPAELSRPTLLDAVRFLQFEVTFDLDPDGDGGVTGNTALPELEFLRLPIRF